MRELVSEGGHGTCEGTNVSLLTGGAVPEGTASLGDGSVGDTTPGEVDKPSDSFASSTSPSPVTLLSTLAVEIIP